MASLVADYRPVHLTEEPLHTPRLPLRGGAGVRIRTHHARSCYLVITPLPLQELATFVLTVTRSEASVQGLREVLRKTQTIKGLGDGSTFSNRWAHLQ